MAGKVSDGAIVTMYPLSKISHALDVLRRSASSEKKTLFAYLPLKITLISTETETAKMEVARNIRFYVTSMGKYYAQNLSTLGFDQSVRKIISAYSKGGSKAATEAVGEDLIEELSFVGSIDEIREKLKKIPAGVVPVFAVDSPATGDISGLRLSMLDSIAKN